MNTLVAFDKYNIDNATIIANEFVCDAIEMTKVQDLSQYGLIILIYKVEFGKCLRSVEDFCMSFNDKKIVLLGIGTTGFDVNKILIRRLEYNKNFIIYSKYTKNIDAIILKKHIDDKYISTDGKSYTEVFIGRLFRLFKRNI